VRVRPAEAGDELGPSTANFPTSAFGGGGISSSTTASSSASVVVEARAETVVGGAPRPRLKAAATPAGAAAAAKEVSAAAAVEAVDAFLGAATLPGGVLDRSENASMSEPERRHWMRVAALRAAAAADEAGEAAVSAAAAAAGGVGGATSEDDSFRLRSAFESPFEARTEHFLFLRDDPRGWDSLLAAAIEKATKAEDEEEEAEALAALTALAKDVEAEALAPSSFSSSSSSSSTVTPPDMRGLGLGAALVAAAAADAAAFASRTSMPSEQLSSSSSSSPSSPLLLDKALLSLLRLSTKDAPPDSLERPARWFSSACSSAAAGGFQRSRGVNRAFSDLAERNASARARERRATARAREREAAERAAVAEAYFPSKEETARASAAERAAAVPYPECIAANSSLAETLLARGSRSTPGERARARALLEECVLLKDAWSSRRKFLGTEAFSYSLSDAACSHPSPAPELLRLAEFLERTGEEDDGAAAAAAVVRAHWLSCLSLVAARLSSLNPNDFRTAAMLLASAADAAEGSNPSAAAAARERARETLKSSSSSAAASAFLGSPGPELARRVSAAFTEPVGGMVSGSTCPRDLWDAGGLPRW